MDQASPLILDVTRSVLAARGALHEDDLADALVDEGWDPDEVDAFLYDAADGPLRILPDRRVVAVEDLLEGRVFTRRLTPVEAEAAAVTLEIDLVAMAMVEDLVDVDAPAHVHVGGEGSCGWVLPSPARAGDLVGVALEEGVVHIRPVSASAPAPAALATLVREPIDVEDLVLTILADDPVAFTEPTLPLAELIDASGLERRGRAVGPPGTDWDAVASAALAEDLRDTYGMSEEGVGLVMASLRTIAAVVDGEDVGAPVLKGLAAGLAAADDDALPALLVEVMGTGAVDDLRAFAHRMLEVTEGAPTAVPLWLLSRVAEAAGETIEAEALVNQAAAADPSVPLVAEDAAWYASDRGDAKRAVALLHRVVDDRDPKLRFLRGVTRSAAGSAGRNDPCPCGSGRKYKHCHLGSGALPLPDRVHWLLDKGREYVQRGPARERLLEVALALGQDEGGIDSLVAAMHDPVVSDLVLFEDGWWDRFVDERGVLLPEDERQLAERWRGLPSAVWRVVDVRPGEAVTVTTPSGDAPLEVRERTGSRSLRADDLVWARVLPDGTTHQFSGAIRRVPLSQRDGLLSVLAGSPTAVDVARALAPRAPVLRNLDNEDLVFCAATYRVPDPPAARVALDAAFGRDGEDEDDEWVQSAEREGQRFVRAVLRLDGDQLSVEANSEERLAVVVSVLADAVPRAVLIEESRRPAAEVAATAGAASEPPAVPPEAQAALDAFIRERERAWVDERIPALGGMTPREALRNPARAADLRSLLRELEVSAAPGGMQADRIRRLLGLA